ncbi:LOB domain-containing protein 24-like [Malania oleifera]|uniref:LOB domain-containing protein 24-like n=1 Tax=Malania oleifera TaxID=397392 RepID=UPI0025AE028D|nr:LOB domain-containing protein 24-like [Malania oleifera]
MESRDRGNRHGRSNNRSRFRPKRSKSRNPRGIVTAVAVAGGFTKKSGDKSTTCKYLRRRCASDCIFSPYFPSNNPQRFACVHRIYGASNVAKMLQLVPVNQRGQVAETLYFEAQCRIQDPVYGCVRTISLLHEHIKNAERELAKTQAEIAFVNAHLHHQALQHGGIDHHTGFKDFLPEQDIFKGLPPHPASDPHAQPPYNQFM